MRTAFTLIELLVVITIIVVLLALLTPALDKAIYQAELASCAARQKAIAGGVTFYAFDSRRSYPYREGVRDPNMVWWPAWLATPATQGGINRSGLAFDDRPKLRPYLSINGFNDPLSTEVDYDTAPVDRPARGRSGGAVAPGPTLWAGWVYKDSGTTAPTGTGTGTGYGPRTKGMFRVGDRWTWTEPGADHFTSSILLGDQLDAGTFGPYVISSHPDSNGVLIEFVRNHGDDVVDPLRGEGVTSRWHSTNGWTGVGTFDLNHAYADGSVHRLNEAPFDPADDSRMDKVGSAQTATNTTSGWNALPIN